MWRVAARFLVLASSLTFTACVPGVPGILQPTPLPPGPIPSAHTDPTQALSASPIPLRTVIVDTSGSFTPIPTFTTTSGTSTSIISTVILTAVLPTETATVLVSVSLDNLPPGTVYKKIRIENQAHAQMDISLHCTTIQGLQTVLEYEVVRNLNVQAPDGNYVYVVYVGGRQIVGSFSLLTVPHLIITVYQDHVVVH